MAARRVCSVFWRSLFTRPCYVYYCTTVYWCARLSQISWRAWCRHLYRPTPTHTLYSVRRWIGSQCRKSAEMLWKFHLHKTVIRAAAFSTFCRGRMWTALAVHDASSSTSVLRPTQLTVLTYCVGLYADVNIHQACQLIWLRRAHVSASVHFWSPKINFVLMFLFYSHSTNRTFYFRSYLWR